ncbi:MAG: hypothetical protein H7066_18075 [Cytophagaceae bacterium]|nr:hypothetical protein [Gemmatimonadaceae bacterium]
MESDRAVPESQGFKQLEQLVRSLGDELATFRKRAQLAEGRVRLLEGALSGGADEISVDRVRALAAENADLKARLGHAAQRTRQLAARVKFIRQQQAKVPSSNGGSATGVTA